MLLRGSGQDVDVKIVCTLKFINLFLTIRRKIHSLTLRLYHEYRAGSMSWKFYMNFI